MAQANKTVTFTPRNDRHVADLAMRLMGGNTKAAAFLAGTSQQEIETLTDKPMRRVA